jgi:CelD/BcsL family acetyltransferase involved in cellulose biosynthesis
MVQLIEWVTGPDAFRALAPQWDALARTGPDPFHSHAWFDAWWRAFAGWSDEMLRVCTVWEDDQLVAGLPAVFAGGVLAALSNVESPVFRPLHRDAAALATVLDAALAEMPAEMTLASLPLDEPAGELLRTQARGARRLMLTGPPSRSPIVDLDGTWEDYRSRMKSKWGSVERKGRKMQREHEAELRMVEAPHDLEAQLRRGLELERSGWKGRGGTAILDRPQHTAFYHEIARHHAARDELRLSEITLDGELVAFDLAILSGGRLYSLKTAYSEAHAGLSPGLVLRRALIERCFALGLDAHELLGHDLPWKYRFATSFRPIANAYVARVRPATLARYTYRRGVRPPLRRAYLHWRDRAGRSPRGA